MNINRHNYEEYFILYMDNELNNVERRMVETFVQNNPDLKDELDILLQSKLVPDNTIVFESKEELIRTVENAAIDLHNYEEWLTLYIDNELNDQQKDEVEKFLALHLQAKNDLLVLQKTKLQPEEIVFPYKESLYRRTEKVRVIQMRWWRIAAAAVLFIAISTTAIFILNNNKQHTENPVTTSSQNNNASQKNDPTKKDKIRDDIKTPVNENPSLAQSSKLEKQKITQANNKEAKKDILNILPTKKDEPIIADTKNLPTNNLPESTENPNFKAVDVNPYIADAIAPKIKTNSPQTTPGLVTKELPNTSDDGLTFAKNTDSDQLDEGGSNKKSRGLFRKAVRFIEKTTGIKPANDDDRVLIGGLAVKLD